MLILIPLNCDDIQVAEISPLTDVKKWGLITLEEGQIVEIKLYDQREEIQGWIDCVIVKSEKEYVWPFMEENIAVLVAHTQNSIDEIVEAFLFKELHEVMM